VATLPSFTFAAIGVARTPFAEKADAPRQPAAAPGAPGTIELFAGQGLEHAVEDLESWERIWVVFVFHEAAGWRPKVLPPRSARRRGVLATRSPHRPNPIGLSAVRLVRVEGLVLHVLDLDLLDGTPVLDVKPYVPYADAFPDAGTGWLASPADPIAPYTVTWSDEARAQIAWLAERGVDLAPPIERALALGPDPSAYRRIRKGAHGGPSVLAVKEWRVRFEEARPARALRVLGVGTGYRARDLATLPGADLDLHRAFVAAFRA
jgi:tRNA-Thr(GGU) m(6)t(6)A37 methyltransferase TsaA